MLRLRRVCKKAQGVTESYLRTHPRSNEVITFDLVFKPSKLSEFLVEDSFCSIPKPVSGFKIHFDSPEQLQNPKLTEFLARYGVQVFELEVKHMNLPLNQQEFIFYEKLPNLKSLTIQFLDEIEGAQARLAASVFPESFRNLKSLIIMEEDTDLPKADFKWKLVEFCKDLERFGCRADPKRYSNLHQILDRNEHTKLKFYDMKPDAYELPVENIGELCKTTIKFNMKWENVPSAGLFQIWRPQLEKIAPHIVSLDFFKGIEDIQGVVLSNIESIRATFGAGEDEVVIDEDDVVDEEDYNLDDIPALLRSVKPKVGSAVFPNLKRLQMLIRLGTHSSRILGGIWEVLTHLEDVTIEAGSTHVGDEAFVGEFIGNPSFRKLTSERVTLSNPYSIDNISQP